jgi:UDP-N-acetylmuramoyl-L-alanyl-D-glutamate--2,6-diaminopimelate ligase
MPVSARKLVAALASAARVIVLHSDEVTSIAHDSRAVTPGGAFVAIPGLHVDGHDYIEAARSRGARFFVLQQDREDRAHQLRDAVRGADACTVVTVPDSRDALARLAAAFYDYPSRQLRIVGVTGTDGKTSTVFLTAAVLEAAGRATDFTSTVAFKEGDALTMNDTHLTSPDAVLVRLAKLSQLAPA